MPPGRRLSCQTQILGDLVIDVPPESQVHKQVVRKEADTRAIELDPATRLCFIEVEEPDMHKPSSDLERVYKALQDQWGIDNLSCDLSIISDLQKTLRKGEWKITAAVFARAPGGGNRLVAIWPGFHDKAFGIAIDVGSTTIAAHLTNLSTGEVTASAGLMNPQIRFGEDLMSRVSYVMMNPGGEKEMTAAIRAGAEHAGPGRGPPGRHRHSPTFWKWCWSAIPVMHHLFLGIDPDGAWRRALRACHRACRHLPGARTRPSPQPRRLGLCAALHRGPCGRRHGRRRPLRSAA